MSLFARIFCPACKRKKSKKIFSLQYSSKEMTSFLDTYYKGLMPINKLHGYEYKLLECQYCNLIYQDPPPSAISPTTVNH